MLRVHRLLKDPQSLPHDFWSSLNSELMLDERWAKEHESEIQFLEKHLPHLERHVWISSSGTMSVDSKWIALSKSAFLNNAGSVNAHLNILSSDSWSLSLPLSHVGGLSIHARSHLLRQKFNERDPHWISLVPTQVFDLVQKNIPAPKSLKGAIVGGDALDEGLYQKALKLNWPILRTYGMSEVGSQLATEPHQGWGLKVLSHAELKFENEKAYIKSECLYTLKAITDFKTLHVEKREADWWPLPDRVQLKDESLTVLGREDLVIKVLGVKLDLVSFESQLKNLLGFEVIVLAKPDERRGQKLIVISENLVNLEKLNHDLLGFQKISEAKVIKQFPRTSLGKIKRGELG